MDFTDMYEWDTKTLASAVKGYFGKQLGEPLLTYSLHVRFIEASSKDRAPKILKMIFF